jgi:hypothetical protein
MVLGLIVLGLLVGGAWFWFFMPPGFQNWLERWEWYRYRVARRRIIDAGIIGRQNMRKSRGYRR